MDLKAFLCPSQQRGRGSRLNIIIIAEGARDCKGKPITCEQVKQVSTGRVAPMYQHMEALYKWETAHKITLIV